MSFIYWKCKTFLSPLNSHVRLLVHASILLVTTPCSFSHSQHGDQKSPLLLCSLISLGYWYLGHFILNVKYFQSWSISKFNNSPPARCQVYGERVLNKKMCFSAAQPALKSHAEISKMSKIYRYGRLMSSTDNQRHPKVDRFSNTLYVYS